MQNAVHVIVDEELFSFSVSLQFKVSFIYFANECKSKRCPKEGIEVNTFFTNIFTNDFNCRNLHIKLYGRLILSLLEFGRRMK